MTATDVVYTTVALVGLALTLFICLYAGNAVLDGLQDSGALSTTANTSVESVQTGALAKTDYLVFASFIGLALAIIILSWFIGGNPIFFFIYFLVNAVCVVVAAILSNVWYDVTTQPVFSSTLALMTKTNHIMTYLPFYMAVIGVIGIIVAYAKPYVSEGGGNL